MDVDGLSLSLFALDPMLGQEAHHMEIVRLCDKRTIISRAICPKTVVCNGLLYHPMTQRGGGVVTTTQARVWTLVSEIEVVSFAKQRRCFLSFIMNLVNQKS